MFGIFLAKSKFVFALPSGLSLSLLCISYADFAMAVVGVLALQGSFNEHIAGTKFQDEVLNLPLAGIEAVLSSDDLQVPSEDTVYDFVLKWARTHYPKLEERREILGSRLGCLIRFPYMTCRRLRKVLTCTDFDPELASKVVVEASTQTRKSLASSGAT